MPMLALDQITQTYPGPHGPVTALAPVSLTVAAGEFVVVQGPSGAGKTTLLLIAGGLLAPSAGTVRLGDADVYALAPETRNRLRAERVGFVFQQFHLLPYLTVLENVLTPTLAESLADAPAHAHELLARFGLAARAHHRPAALSTGERQRAALARALLRRPALLLADEPTGNLDPTNAAAVLAALRAHATDGGAVLLVTHDDRANPGATRVVRLAPGGARESSQL